VYRTSACSRSKSRELKSIVAWMLSPFTEKRQWSGESNQRRQRSQGIQGDRSSMEGVYNIVDLRELRHIEKGFVEGQTATRHDVVEAREESDKNLTAQQRWPSCVGEGRRSRRQILAKLPRKYEGFSNVRFRKTSIDTARVIPGGRFVGQ
jgi:hypothetical protein